MQQPFIPIVMCGGSGSRLWPLSRRDMPKPFITLPGYDRALIDHTYARFNGAPKPSAVITITAAPYAFLCERHFKQSGLDVPHIIIAEPSGRNTAPAIAVATSVAARRFGADARLVAVPADHDMTCPAAFRSALAAALAAAARGIVLIGITPTYPATGYGYLEYDSAETADAKKVLRFTEKPDAERAAQFIAQGNFFWNGGIFCYTAANALAQIAQHCPELNARLPQVFADGDGDDSPRDCVLRPSAEVYQQLPSISFDYAVMEKADDVRVVGGDNIGWRDVGSWQSIADTLPADAAGNRARGNAQLRSSRDSMAVSPHRLTVGIGLDNIHIVDTPDALLVARADSAPALAEVYKTLIAAGADAATTPTTVKKPWGSYTVIAEGANYKIKRIDVASGAQLSLQSHAHRSEHWVTVEGVMTVVIEQEEFDMPVNQACFIPQGSKHRMRNNGQAPAAVIEVQIGAYLGEDDIVRYDDIYGRH